MDKQEKIAAKAAALLAEPELHPWRNAVHLEMPFGLINDPNGLAYYNGKYHIFYQWNPFGCVHQSKHWGLVTTADFVHYDAPRLALCPEDWFDKDGCYSGCAQVQDGVLQLFYTGNVKDAGVRASYQCLASLDEAGVMKKQGVLIKAQPEGYTAHFRDPYVFQENGSDYMVLGAQTERLQGCALLYRKDGAQWLPVGELQTQLDDFGYMWECPNLVKLPGGAYAFIFSPQGLEAEELYYQNRYQSGYVIGALAPDVPSLAHGEFNELDRGFDFYAPQVFTQAGRNILLAWIGLPDEDAANPTAALGWMYALTLPRELLYKEGRLYQWPIQEIETLRDGMIIALENKLDQQFSLTLPTGAVEILLALELRQADAVALKFLFGEEWIEISYDRNTQIVMIDRTHMRLGGQGVRKFRLLDQRVLDLRIFVDHSVLEIYYQGGEQVTTLMYFPEKANICPELCITGTAQLGLRQCRVWHLRSIVFK